MAGENGGTGEKGKAARRGRGFARAIDGLRGQMREIGAKRGFAEARVLTEWPAIAGEALAACCRPVRLTHAEKGGLGGVLVVQADAARGPEVEMLAPRIAERVNAFYGYRAVSRVRVTQEADGPGFVSGFADRSRGFDRTGAPERRDPGISDEDARAQAHRAAALDDIDDPRLRAALERLGAGVIRKAARSGRAGRKDDSG